jgi:hypothetical protein
MMKILFHRRPFAEGDFQADLTSTNAQIYRHSRAQTEPQ